MYKVLKKGRFLAALLCLCLVVAAQRVRACDGDPFRAITLRGSMGNSLSAFSRGDSARVAFLGGSITAGKGWRDSIEVYLQRRFPYTRFDFLNAGIGSTGSVPGAFRFKTDVLRNGPVDLLFVEAAVNDATNGTDSVRQVRGMEGEVRQALLANPLTDIVMLHFIQDSFIPLYASGRTPEEIQNHERVAAYYLVPSADLAREISGRIAAGEFTWQQFGGVHPAPLGHGYYAATVIALLDGMWAGAAPAAPHAIPAAPLDPHSYFTGDLLDIRQAVLGPGWRYVEMWNPADNASKRRGFVDVPMIEGRGPGAELTLRFEGCAIGLFCVCGPSAAMIEYCLDGGQHKTLDTFTPWSRGLYIPWVYVLAEGLPRGQHTLTLRIAAQKHEKSSGHELQIRNFVIAR